MYQRISIKFLIFLCTCKMASSGAPCSIAALRLASGCVVPRGLCTKRFLLLASSSHASNFQNSLILKTNYSKTSPTSYLIPYFAATGSIYPQAPCLLDMIFLTFSSNRLAITLSLLLAAVIKWSHILSSSLRSSSVWAHCDCKIHQITIWRNWCPRKRVRTWITFFKTQGF